MRILFVSPNPFLAELGAAKVLLGVADAMGSLGWDCDFLSSVDLGMAFVTGIAGRQEFVQRLREKLHVISGDYDVIDYDHVHLPFARSEFARTTLMVARSVLLMQPGAMMRIPRRRGFQSICSALIRGRQRSRDMAEVVAMADQTMLGADLVNVSNTHDREQLLRRGIDSGKIFVLPFGLNRADRQGLESVPLDVPSGQPTVCFIGTFDERKGAGDFPSLVEEVSRSIPRVRFKLLGTAGLLRTAEQVFARFPTRLRAALEVVPSFPAQDLPNLLPDCWVGVFPSYLEGFPFAVLEMLAAALPVVAYDAPGPPMMLPDKWLVPAGDVKTLAHRLIGWLTAEPPALRAIRIEARALSQPFRWDEIGRRTISVYNEALRAPPV